MKNIIILLVLSMSFSSFAKMELNDSYKRELISRAPGLTAKSVQKRLQRATILMSKSAYGKAIEILSNMTKDKRKPFEMGKIWQTLAYAYAQSEQYPKARNAFEQVIKIDALPYKPTMQSLFALAQLQVMADKYDLALGNMEKWFYFSTEEKPSAYVFMASIYYEKGNKDKALDLVLKALKITQTPKENWLVFAVSLLYSKERYKEASEYLYKLVEKKPSKKSYWAQLAGAMLNMDKGEHALAVLELAMMMNLLDKEGEIKNVISLYISNGLPYEASQLLILAFKEKKLKKDKKNLELLSNALIQAKEYDAAMKPLADAAALSKDGALFALQGRLYLEKEDFNKAISSFNKAINKGVKAKDKGRIYVENAIAHIQIAKYQEAETLLNKALKFDDQKKAVNNWKSYLASMQ